MEFLQQCQRGNEVKGYFINILATDHYFTLSIQDEKSKVKENSLVSTQRLSVIQRSELVGDISC